MSKKVTILYFSGRKSGNCAGIVDYLKDYYKQTDVCIYNIDQTFHACGNCDYECLKPEEKCPNTSPDQTEIMERVCDSNLVYYIVPNYCGFPCASYFAFNERSVGFFNMDREKTNQYMSIKKRFIIVSNTESEIFFKAMKQQTNESPEILYLKTRKYEKRSIAGDLMDSSEAKADLEAFLAAHSF